MKSNRIAGFVFGTTFVVFVAFGASPAKAVTIYTEDFEIGPTWPGNDVLAGYGAYGVNEMFSDEAAGGVVANVNFPNTSRWMFIQTGADISGNRDGALPEKGVVDAGANAVFIALGIAAEDSTDYTLSMDIGGRVADGKEYEGTYTMALFASTAADATVFDPTSGSTLIGSFDVNGSDANANNPAILPVSGMFTSGAGLSGNLFISIAVTDATPGDAFQQPLIDNILVDAALPTSEPTTVPFDIKPGGDINPINLKSKGVLSMAIFSTDDFNVSDINVSTLLFGDPTLLDANGTGVSPLRYSFQDVSHDGLLDLSLKFSTRDAVDYGALGPDTIEGLVTGKLFDGTRIEGLDSIRIVPPNGSNGTSGISGNGLQLSAAIPEPTTLTLAICALLGVAGRRNRRA